MKTIVVRNALAVASDAMAFGPSTEASAEISPTLASTGRALPDILVEDLSESDRQDIAGREEFLTADPIPLSLIHPTEKGDVGHDYAPFVVSGAEGQKLAWGIAETGAAMSTYSGRGVPVAVLDTGIDRSHPAFTDPTLDIVECNFTDASPEDVDGHGTHCAGTIFGRDVGGVRIGVAPGITKAYIGKVIPGDSGDLIKALMWAFDSGARVISMSLSFDFPKFVLNLENQGVPPAAAISRGLDEFRRNIASFDAVMNVLRVSGLASPGALVIAATGNESAREAVAPNPSYVVGAGSPAASLGIIAVGALERVAGNLKIAKFSNTNPQLCAPGVGVLSAKANTSALVAASGTSMACPHVAGLAALYWQQAIDAGTGLLSAPTISSRLVGRALPRGFVPESRPIDVGNGLAIAPQ